MNVFAFAKMCELKFKCVSFSLAHSAKITLHYYTSFPGSLFQLPTRSWTLVGHSYDVAERQV